MGKDVELSNLMMYNILKNFIIEILIFNSRFGGKYIG